MTPESSHSSKKYFNQIAIHTLPQMYVILSVKIPVVDRGAVVYQRLNIMSMWNPRKLDI